MTQGRAATIAGARRRRTIPWTGNDAAPRSHNLGPLASTRVWLATGVGDRDVGAARRPRAASRRTMRGDVRARAWPRADDDVSARPSRRLSVHIPLRRACGSVRPYVGVCTRVRHAYACGAGSARCDDSDASADEAVGTEAAADDADAGAGGPVLHSAIAANPLALRTDRRARGRIASSRTRPPHLIAALAIGLPQNANVSARDVGVAPVLLRVYV
jgi:hypothetical protein